MITAEPAQVKESLRDAGLTEYETAAYSSLLAKKERTAEEIADVGRVPITRVYDTLEQLVSKGFAVAVPGRPKRYRATPPERAVGDYLSYLRRNFESNIEQIEGALKRVQQSIAPLYWQSHLEVKPEQLIEPIEDLAQMENHTRIILQSAQEEVLISSALFTWLPRVRRELVKVLGKGAQMRILMHTPSSDLKRHLQAISSAGAKIRQSPDEWYPVRGTLVDSQELAFVIWASEEPEKFWYPKVYQPHRTRNPGLIRLFRESFEFRWAHSRALRRF